jgi:hypothetical protein
MESSKGQTMAFVILIFAAVVISVVAMMILTAFSDGGLASYDVEGAINQEVSSVRGESVVTVTLHDTVMRAQSDGGMALSNDYGDMTAYRLISYYFTEGNYVYIGDRQLSKMSIRNDLEKYFRYKMEKHYNTGSTKADYYLSLGNDDLVVKKDDEYPEQPWERTTHRIPLAGGKGVQFGIWRRTEGSIYGGS